MKRSLDVDESLSRRIQSVGGLDVEADVENDPHVRLYDYVWQMEIELAGLHKNQAEVT